VKSTASLETLSSNSPKPDKPVRRLPSWSIPVAILLGFAIVFLVLFGDRILPAPKVDVAIVLAAPAAEQTATEEKPATPTSAEGSPLFQASGWIEPAPLPIKATALIDGVVEAVHVLQGQTVKKGDLLATLITEDGRLALAITEQKHRMAQSTYTAHQSAIEAANKKVAGLEAQLAAAATLRDEAADRLKRFDKLPQGAVSQADVVASRLNRDREDSQYLVAVSAVDEMKAEVERLKTESQIRKDEIEAAALEVEKAKLALSRANITSPIDGRIIRLLAAPGQKKMLQDQDPESSTIAILYRPGEIQVRVDVPLADAAGLQIGQHVRIRCSLLPEKIFHGKVTLISGEADLQRNTLQAKVSIDDPVDELRPEMLCRVEFLETMKPSASTSTPSAGSLATWIPEAALAENQVWVCNSESKRVSKRAVTPTSEKQDGYLRISEGLRPGEWVVLSPNQLQEGKRVTPTLIKQ
jgi:RND family efflux transporter MFP subunit